MTMDSDGIVDRVNWRSHTGPLFSALVVAAAECFFRASVFSLPR